MQVMSLLASVDFLSSEMSNKITLGVLEYFRKLVMVMKLLVSVGYAKGDAK